MKQLILEYLEMYEFESWDLCKKHFEMYLSDEKTLDVSFTFFGRPVGWSMDMEDLKHYYHYWDLKRSWTGIKHGQLK